MSIEPSPDAETTPEPAPMATKPSAAKMHFDDASAKLKQVAALLPRNLAVVERYGAALERDGRYIEALRRYLTFATAERRVFEIPNRASAILSMSEAWLTAVPGTDPAERSRLAAVLRTRKLTAAANQIAYPTVQDLHAALLHASATESKKLVSYLTFRHSWSRVLTALLPGRRKDLQYQRQFVRPGRKRRDRIALQRLGLVSTNIQLEAPWPSPLGQITPDAATAFRSEIRRRRRRTRAPECTYNAACCRSRLFELTGAPADCRATLDLLRAVLRSERPEYWINSIRTDPDLAPVRRTAEYRAWWQEIGQEATDLTAQTWAAQLADLMRARWNRYSLLDTGTSATVAEDDQLFESLVEYVRSSPTTAPGDDDPTRPREDPWSKIVEAAAALHVRVPFAPPLDPTTFDAWQREAPPKSGLTLEALLARSKWSGDHLPGARLHRWAEAKRLIDERASIT